MRDFLLGKEKIGSRTEYKYAMLRAQLGILLGAICFTYIFIDLINGVFVYFPWYLGTILASGLVIQFNRKRKYLLSSIILLITANLLVFLIATLEASQGGAFFYFMATSATGLVVLNPINKRLGVASVGFSILLAAIAYFGEGLPIEAPTGNENYETISFTVNFILGLISCILVLIFVMDRNEESENTLIAKQEELKGLAKELEKSKNRYAMAVDGAEAGIYEWDIFSNRLMASTQFKKLLGYDMDEDLDTDFDFYLSRIHPDYKQSFKDNVKAVVDNGTRYQHELQIRLKNGTYSWFLNSGIVSMKNGSANMAVGSIIDINNRKNAEQQLRHKNTELEKANEELDRFVYRASHDMRAPLSTLMGLLNLAKYTKSEKELDEYHELMINRIHTMDGFIKEVTDYSRNARLEMAKDLININQFVEEVLNSFEFLANESEVQFQYEIEPDIEIYSDKARLKVVLSNLVYNSIKYHDSSKPQRYVNVQAIKQADCLAIRVIDNGIGISKDYQQNIFDMFFRASEKSTGSGLGLYIVQETLLRLKGSITCVSVENEGSTFEVRIPLDPKYSCLDNN